METDTNLSPSARSFWDEYVVSELAAGKSTPQLYGTMVIGGDAVSADVGAQLILSGRKTATSALPADFHGTDQRPPRVGDLSLVLDGRGEPVCIVKTVKTRTQVLGDIDEAFAWDYGEWDGTLTTWRERMLGYYRGSLAEDPLATPLFCEWFVRVWPLHDAKG